MHVFNQFRTSLRTRPQFFHLLLLFFAALLSVIIVFYIYVANENTATLTEQYYTSQEEYLRQNIDFIHSDLGRVFSLTNNTLYNSVVIQSVMNPKVVDYEHTRNLVNTLSDTAEHNDLIMYLSYYVSSTDTVFESNKSATSLQACSLYPVWHHYLTDNDAYRSYSDDMQTDILYDNGNIYMIQGFQRSLDNSVAYMMALLNPSVFTRNIENDSLAIYNNSGLLLYGENELSADTAPPEKSDTYYQIKQERDATYICYQDSVTGWIFVYHVSLPSSAAIFGASQNLLIVFVLLLLIGLILSIFISYYAYQPIHDLVQNAEEQFGNQFSLSGSKNEFDYLKSTYSNIINHQEELVTIFPLIYDSVAEKVFHDLFFDYETPSAELAGRLDMLSEKFRYYQRFRVILAVPEHFSEEFNSRMPQLSQKISALPEAVNKISICPKTDLGIIVVLGFCADHSVAQIRSSTDQFCRALKNVMKPSDKIRTGIGGICTNIIDVRSSLDDAKTNLTFQQYASSIPNLPDNDPIFAHAERNEILRQIRMFYDQMEVLEESELQKNMEKILNGIRSSTMDFSYKKITCGFFLNLMHEKYAVLQHAGDENEKEASSILSDITNEEEMLDLVFTQISDMLHSIWQYYHAPNYRHIQLALDYIAENFSDPNLSLESVSSHIGINATYLSRTFKSILGQNFLYYVNNQRITNAKKLLMSSDLPIQEIGTLVGYTNMTTFFRVFKKYTDTTPRVFRQDNRGEAPR